LQSLVFSIENITPEGISGHRTLDPSWFSLPPDADDPIRPIVLSQPVEVDFRLVPFKGDFRVELRTSTVALLSCSRCLSQFPFPVTAEGTLTLLRLPLTGALKEEMELTLEDLDTSYFEGDTIDLSQLVYEQIVLSFPMKPLCKEDCKGLCPRCGIDLNFYSCDCEKVKMDPRWAPLLKLRA